MKHQAMCHSLRWCWSSTWIKKSRYFYSDYYSFFVKTKRPFSFFNRVQLSHTSFRVKHKGLNTSFLAKMGSYQGCVWLCRWWEEWWVLSAEKHWGLTSVMWAVWPDDLPVWWNICFTSHTVRSEAERDTLPRCYLSFCGLSSVLAYIVFFPEFCHFSLLQKQWITFLTFFLSQSVFFHTVQFPYG